GLRDSLRPPAAVRPASTFNHGDCSSAVRTEITWEGTSFAMSTSTNIAWNDFAWLLLQAAALFAVATFVFDAIHYALHCCLSSRQPWLRRLASPHQAHHDFCDRQLTYHDEKVASNLVLHVIPEYATQMAICSAALLLLRPLPVLMVMGSFSAILVGV